PGFKARYGMPIARSISAIESLPQVSAACATGAGTSRRIFSLATDIGLLDHFAPLRVVLANKFREVRGRIGEKLDTLRLELRFHVGTAEDTRHFAVDLARDVGGRLRRHKDAEPGIDGEAGQRVG